MKYDYIIVGAGSAGCVLANRLSADPKNKVCLVEAGGNDKGPIIYTPMISVFTTVCAGFLNWRYKTSPQPGMNNREIYCPRGKILGGSSSINAMVYTRGQKEDFDSWAEQGNDGWSYEEILPYFKRSENNERGGDEYHGGDGPLHVSELRNKHPVNGAFIQAAVEQGERLTDDFNGAIQEGVGWFQVTQKDGQRCSSAAAFLHPVLKQRSNLTVITNAHTTRVLLDGKRAVGVEILQKGKKQQLTANKEIVLSAGTFASPQLLLLSGIGAKEKLEPHDIEQQHDLPGVGENLQEHADILMAARDKSATTWATVRPMTLFRSIMACFEYLFKRKGMLTSTGTEAGGFVRIDENSKTPDVQLHFSASAMENHGRHLSHYARYGFSAHACVLRPKSRGSVCLHSAEPTDDPNIDLNLLDHEDDMSLLIKAVKRVRQYFNSPELAEYFEEELTPGPSVNSDAEIEQFLREKTQHVYHPVGTCKMGSDDMAVVDNKLRVHGLEGLRVVDASIMPTIVSGNTNAPAIMIAEKASDMILGAEANT